MARKEFLAREDVCTAEKGHRGLQELARARATRRLGWHSRLARGRGSPEQENVEIKTAAHWHVETCSLWSASQQYEKGYLLGLFSHRLPKSPARCALAPSTGKRGACGLLGDRAQVSR